MKSFTIGIAIFLAAVPAWGGHCRARVKVVKQQVVKKVIVPQAVVNNYYAASVVYPAPAPVAVQAAQIAPYYQPAPVAQAVVCCVPCCPTVVAPGSAIPPGTAPQPGDNQPPAAGAADAAMQELFTRTCVQCHGGTAPKANLDLTDVTRLTAEQRMLCALLVQTGAMPKDEPTKVTDEEAQALMKWAIGK